MNRNVNCEQCVDGASVLNGPKLQALLPLRRHKHLNQLIRRLVHK